MIVISHNVSIPEHELNIHAIRAQGAGGQNVNKVSTAIHLRFDYEQSSLPDYCKAALRQFNDHRMTQDGQIIIKAQQYRSQEKNRLDAIARLQTLIQKALYRPRKRIATKPSKTAKKKRLEHKAARGKVKQLRGKIDF